MVSVTRYADALLNGGETGVGEGPSVTDSAETVPITSATRSVFKCFILKICCSDVGLMWETIRW